MVCGGRATGRHSGKGTSPRDASPRDGELRLLLGREGVLDVDQQRDVGALHLALDAQHFVHLRQRRSLIDGRLFEQRGESLRLLLHTPLQVHHLALEILDRLRDRGALLGAEPDVLLVLHHELGRKQHARERILRRLRRLLGTRRRNGEQDENRNQADTERFHRVLRSRLRGPSCGTLRSRSSPGSLSRKSVGACHRTVARSMSRPTPFCPRRVETITTAITATTTAASFRMRRPGAPVRRARAAATVAWNGGVPAAASRRSASKACFSWGSSCSIILLLSPTAS